MLFSFSEKKLNINRLNEDIRLIALIVRTSTTSFKGLAHKTKTGEKCYESKRVLTDHKKSVQLLLFIDFTSIYFNRFYMSCRLSSDSSALKLVSESESEESSPFSAITNFSTCTS